MAVSPHTDLLLVILNDEPNFEVPNCFQLIHVDKFDKSPVFFLPAHTPHSSTFQVNPPMVWSIQGALDISNPFLFTVLSSSKGFCCPEGVIHIIHIILIHILI